MDMCIDMVTDMCTDVYMDAWIDMFMDMCIDMSIAICIDVFTDPVLPKKMQNTIATSARNRTTDPRSKIQPTFQLLFLDEMSAKEKVFGSSPVAADFDT